MYNEHIETWDPPGRLMAIMILGGGNESHGFHPSV